jgi:hypothetical protein
MDSKKVLQKLLKIAENQQKIIMKLAQAQQGLPPDSLPNSQVSVTDNSKPKPPTDTPPAQSKPNAPTRTPSKALFDAVEATQGLRGVLRHVNPPSGNELKLIFSPGKLNQANFDAITKIYQGLLNSNTIFTNYKLTYGQG